MYVFFHVAYKVFTFFTTSPIPVRKSDQASVVIGPVIAAMAYKYKRLVLTRKTLWRSLWQLDETRERIKKFYNYCSLSSLVLKNCLTNFLKNYLRN